MIDVIAFVRTLTMALKEATNDKIMKIIVNRAPIYDLYLFYPLKFSYNGGPRKSKLLKFS